MSLQRKILEAIDDAGMGPKQDVPPVPDSSEKLEDDTAVEALADVAHESWAGWMRYLFEKSTDNPDGTVTIPVDQVERWRRQVDTPYNELSEEEKESDRKEARKYIAAMHPEAPEAPERETREPQHSMDMHDEPGEDDGW